MGMNSREQVVGSYEPSLSYMVYRTDHSAATQSVP